jgi:hypothetical protein
MKTPAEMIVNSSRSHPIERQSRQSERLVVSGPPPFTKE